MKWSFSNDLPIYAQLIEQIKTGVATGAFPRGERLPSVRDLAMEAGVNPNTMQRALAQLESEGLVYSQRTAGRFVTGDEERIGEMKRSLAHGHIRAFMAAMNSLSIDREEALALLEAEYRKETGEDEYPDM